MDSALTLPLFTNEDSGDSMISEVQHLGHCISDQIRRIIVQEISDLVPHYVQEELAKSHTDFIAKLKKAFSSCLNELRSTMPLKALESGKASEGSKKVFEGEADKEDVVPAIMERLPTIMEKEIIAATDGSKRLKSWRGEEKVNGEFQSLVTEKSSARSREMKANDESQRHVSEKEHRTLKDRLDCLWEIVHSEIRAREEAIVMLQGTSLSTTTLPDCVGELARKREYRAAEARDEAIEDTILQYESCAHDSWHSLVDLLKSVNTEPEKFDDNGLSGLRSSSMRAHVRQCSQDPAHVVVRQRSQDCLLRAPTPPARASLASPPQPPVPAICFKGSLHLPIGTIQASASAPATSDFMGPPRGVVRSASARQVHATAAPAATSPLIHSAKRESMSPLSSHRSPMRASSIDDKLRSPVSSPPPRVPCQYQHASSRRNTVSSASPFAMERHVRRLGSSPVVSNSPPSRQTLGTFSNVAVGHIISSAR